MNHIIVNELIIIILLFKKILSALTSSEAGLVISSAMSLVAQLQLCVRKATEAENLMTNVERVIEYSKIPPEAPFDCNTNHTLGKAIRLIIYVRILLPYTIYLFSLHSCRYESEINLARKREYPV